MNKEIYFEYISGMTVYLHHYFKFMHMRMSEAANMIDEIVFGQHDEQQKYTHTYTHIKWNEYLCRSSLYDNCGIGLLCSCNRAIEQKKKKNIQLIFSDVVG